MVAGHSGRGQVAQRYAILAHGDAIARAAGINLGTWSRILAAMPGSAPIGPSRASPPAVQNTIAGNTA